MEITIDGIEYDLVPKSKNVNPEPKRDWEILESTNRVGHVHDFHSTCLFTGCLIHAVKRLSDGEVFAVGDIVNWDLSQLPGQSKAPFPITSFEINEILPEKRMFCNNQNIDICYLSKSTHERKASPIPPKPEPLFVTEDLKAVFPGDTVWGVSVQATGEDMVVEYKLPFDKNKLRTNRRWFSSKFAAHNHAITHAPKLSIFEVVGWIDENYSGMAVNLNKLRWLVKSKLNLP